MKFIHILNMLALITGYKRTGKDTLARHLSEGTYKQNYVVYGKDQMLSTLDYFRGANIYAFANGAKDVVSLMLGYSFPNDRKDELIPGESITYRQKCIQVAEDVKSRHGRDAWATVLSWKMTGDSIISDWRFPEERWFDYKQKVITMRVFRSEVPIPALDDGTEHAIDEYETDFFMLTSEADYEQACTLFPYLRSMKRLN